MLQISALQLAELLSGVARAQAAMIHGIESAMPGTRSSFIVPALHNVAHTRDHPDPTLTDLPVRVLLSYMGRIGPDLEALARELERLLSTQAAGADEPAPAASEPATGARERAAVPAAAEPAAAPAQSPADTTTTLDFRDLDTGS